MVTMAWRPSGASIRQDLLRRRGRAQHSLSGHQGLYGL